MAPGDRCGLAQESHRRARRDHVGEVLLGMGRDQYHRRTASVPMELLGKLRADDGRPPHPAVDDNGRTHRRAEAQITEPCVNGTCSILIAVHPGGAPAAQHHRRDAVALE
jgi:hypothetical protein